MNKKPAAHFIDNYLINPTNAVTVTLIGAGGTGSRMLSALHCLHTALLALGRPGLFVTVFDPDQITEANLGRQLFMSTELGMNKAVAIVNRFNRCFGTGWKAVSERFDHTTAQPGNIIISCVDEVSPRFEIADILMQWKKHRVTPTQEPLYWMDFGNTRSTGQVILSTVSAIAQPKSKQFQPRSALPLPTVEFKSLWEAGRDQSNQPSCSLAEALTKQDLFINPILAAWGGQLLTDMFTKGIVSVRGIFVNANTYRTQPLPVI